MKKYNIIKNMMLVFMMFAGSLQAKFIATNNDKEIQEVLGKYTYTIICIMNQNKKNPREIKSAKDALRIASNSRLYKDLLKKDIGFLFIEMNDKNVAEIKMILNIQNIPGCALFAQTKKFFDIPLSENISSLMFLNILQDNLQHEIKDLAEQREEEAEKIRQERIEQESRYGFYPYYQYYYDPYWANGPYWGTWGWSGGRAAWGSNRGYWNHSNEHESGNHNKAAASHKK